MYSSFAEIYDQLMDKSLYPKWLSFTDNFAPMGSKVVLDLACGTGDFSILLAKDGFKVMGLDNSEEMLATASSKLDEDLSSVIFVKKDMRDLEGIGKFDLVTCYDDSLNYLLEFEGLVKVFKGVYENLNSGGVFLFDVITPYQVNYVYRDFYYNYSDDQSSLLWSTFPGEYPNSIVHDLVIFKYDSKINGYHRYQEQQMERAYDISKFVDGLKKVGFTSIETLSNFGKDEIDSKTKRWFFIAKKS